MDTFGERVKNLRDKQGFKTQLAFLKAVNEAGANLSQGRLSELEGGTDIPNGSTVAVIADVLNTSADYLLLRTDNPSPVVKYEAVH
jgi:transcriptional regulator with XRE-family HTH domain